MTAWNELNLLFTAERSGGEYHPSLPPLHPKLKWTKSVPLESYP